MKCQLDFRNEKVTAPLKYELLNEYDRKTPDRFP